MTDLDEAMRRAFDAAHDEFLRIDTVVDAHGDVRGTVDDWCEQMVKAALASLAESGWVLVPREATAEMNVAGGEAQTQSIGSWGQPNVAWRAMIAAAPKPGDAT